ncbi:PREDICTED: nuclear transcription factor Y subunit B-3-like [Nelumbo nucifera]|uniref:Transcription factor CBF/NF-Y/archaeal histone domain-containing protein n=2 Tax=Nelumbo nucifera TaxID=4432 RepID=A0A822Z546_NELNU|nr:PREDICTED: nuclear transcription factor Y subunit B-3-like [Nelumbo nucifera]DAD40202.1 TPA_asm: hypothetical protein HUJ06_014525 [Nelumbo nucifera]
MTENASDSSSKEQDRFLPIANVSRIMKKSLPANAKISKEAKETVQECVSEFISFITGEASDKCQREKRKTINGDDLLWAMTTLGFENYVGPLKIYLNKYREIEGEKNSMLRQGDQSPTEETANTCSNNNYAVTVLDKVVTDPMASRATFQSFNGGFYSLGAQVAAKNYGDEGRMVDYGDNSRMGTLYTGKI